jgi:hypothetical protein
MFALRGTTRLSGLCIEGSEKGEPLPFEDLALYRSRQKRDRLTPEIISEYLTRFGYGSLDGDFWISAEPTHLLCEREFRLSGEVLQ